MFMNPMMTEGMTEQMKDEMQRRMYMNMGARMMMAGGQGKSTGEALGSSMLGGMNDSDSMLRAGLSTQMQGMQLNKMKQQADASKSYMDALSGMEAPGGEMGPVAMGSARMGNPNMLMGMMNPSKIQQGNVTVGDNEYPYLFSQDAMGGQSNPRFMPQPNAYSMMGGLFGGGPDGQPTAPTKTAPVPPPTLSSSIKAAEGVDTAAAAAKETKRAMGGKMDLLSKNMRKAGMSWAGGQWMKFQPGEPSISEADAKKMYSEFEADFGFYGPGDQAEVTKLMRQLKQKYGF